MMQQLLLGYGGSSSGGGSDVFEMMFTEPGTYDFVPPAGVTSVNVVAVGGGGGCAHYPNSVIGTSGGGGGSLSYKNNISVSSSNTYTVTVGARGSAISTETGYNFPAGYNPNAGSTASNGGDSQFALGGTVYCKAVGGSGASGGNGGAGGNSSSNIGDGGGSGGDGGDNGGTQSYWAFGGGAGGYSGDGGHGGRWEAGGNNYDIGATAGAANSGAAGGAAGWAVTCGVGVFGKGTTGAINDPGSGGTSTLYGKSGGTQFGKYGGGGSGHGSSAPGLANIGQCGCVRIVWYSGSSFPSTNVDAPAGLTDEELRTKGTPIGNMTQDGGLSAAFDGTTTGDYTVSARLDPSTGAHIGKDFGENVNIRQVVITRPDGDGSTGSNCFPGSGSLPLLLEHSHDGTNWQIAISRNNTTNKDLTINIGINIVARYWRVRFQGDQHGGSVRQMVFKSS
jgi:hypothetical protein